MRTRILLAGLACLLLFACSKEDDLTPTEIKNWYAIEYEEGMDAVDQKIYDLYEDYGIAIFYNDTLGSEDRGRRDSAGNVVLYYEVVNWSYNMTTGTGYTFEHTPVDVSTWESKSRMLPLLNFLEGLLGFVQSADVNIPFVMIAENMRQGSASWNVSDKLVCRGFNFLGVALDSYDDNDADVRANYRSEFISQTCASKIENMTETFYAITESAFVQFCGEDDVWGTWYSGSSSSLVPQYATYNGWMNLLTHYEDSIATLNTQRAELQAQIDAGTLTEESEEWLTCLENIEELEGVKAMEDEVVRGYAEYRPEAFGFLGLNVLSETSSQTPSQAEDLDMYLNALFTYTTEEFSELYADFPVCVLRFTTLHDVMTEAGFDLDAIRNMM